MAEYKGTVELIAGITQANGQTFALVNAPDVQVGDERLPETLNKKAPVSNPEFTGSISMGRTENSVIGENSVALGESVQAVGDSSVALGHDTYAAGSCQFVFGRGNVGDITPEWDSSIQYERGDKVHFNSSVAGDHCWQALEANKNIQPGTNYLKWIIASDNNYVEIVGGGSTTVRRNLRTLDWTGNEHLSGTLYVKSNGYGATGGKEVATLEHVQNVEHAIAPEFNANTAYQIGDCVTHEGNLYIFFKAHEAGTPFSANEVFGRNVKQLLDKKSDKLSSGQYTENNLLSADASGNIKDSGYAIDDTSTSGLNKLWSANKSITTFAPKDSPQFLNCIKLGTSSYTPGASGEASIAAGSQASASGKNSIAIGGSSRAEDDNAIAIGISCVASAKNSVAIGYNAQASANYAISLGSQNKATASGSFAEGWLTEANGSDSHSEGYKTKANGEYSHAEGTTTVANGTSSHVFGRYNIPDSYDSWPEWIPGQSYHSGDKVKVTNGDKVTGYLITADTAATTRGSEFSSTLGQLMNYVEIVGNGGFAPLGIGESNARTLDWNGNEWLAGKLTLGAGPENDMDAVTKQYVDSSFAVQDAMIYKGVITAFTGLPTSPSKGWTYKVSQAFDYNNVHYEVGDMFICNTDTPSASRNIADWDVIQTNLDGAVIGPASSTNSRIALFDGTTGKLLKQSSYTAGAAAAKGVDTNFNNTSSANLPTTAAVATQLALKAAGPESSTTNHVALFSDTTGKVIKDGGLVISSVSIDTNGNVTVGRTDGLSITNENIKTLLDGKINKPSSATTGHVALFNNGNAGIKDGGTIKSLVIDDSATSTDKTWSSDNINTIKANKQNPVFEGSVTLGTRNGSVGLNSAAFGTDNTSSGNNSIAEGLTTTSSGTASHAEGERTIANGAGSHAEGDTTTARGNASHSEGVYTIAFGDTSHAEGQYTVAVTPFSHVGGRYNVPSSMSSAPQWKANTEYQISQPIKNDGHYYVCRDKHTSGEDFDFDSAHWNETGVEQDYLEIIGNGIASSSRSNARALDLYGNEYLAGDIYVNCDLNSTGGSKLLSESYIAPMSDVQAIINAWG